jgi:DNA polymerase-4
MTTRKIIHIDMDAFYASVEQRDHPELAGKPVIVGGRPDSRGVVAACSYEARAFGIRSAMPCAQAYRLCAEAIFIRPRLNRYREISEQIMEIFSRYTDLIEPLSLDEAYLDVTVNHKNQASATLLAKEICRTIYRETGLTASAGVSCNKFVAKIASDLNKPNGISVIEPDQVEAFIAALPIGKFHGIGKVTEKKMLGLDIKTGADLRNCSRTWLVEHFGKPGLFYYQIVRGNDPRPVQPVRIRKSVGAERTLKEDTRDMAEIAELLNSLAERVSQTLVSRELTAQTLTLKVRYSDFTTISRSISWQRPVSQKRELLHHIPELLDKTEAGTRPIRLLGIAASNLLSAVPSGPSQLMLPFLDQAG